MRASVSIEKLKAWLTLFYKQPRRARGARLAAGGAPAYNPAIKVGVLSMGAPEVRTTAAGTFDEQFFHLLADAIPHLVWSSSVDGFEDYCNRRFCEYTGLSQEALSGSGWEAIVHPEDLERSRARWRDARASGSRYEIEYRLRRHDGDYLWHHGTAEPLRVDGRIVRWFGTCTDIDARKRAEERVEELQRTSRIIADGIPHMLWTAGLDGVLDFLNARCLDYTGLTAEQTRSGGWQDVIHPDDLPACADRWQRALVDGRGFEAEYRLRRHDGVHRWHSHTVLPLHGPDGEILSWYGTCTDIEDQKAVTERLQGLVGERTGALRASEGRLRAIIQNEPECVKLLDAQGRLLEMNAAGLAMIEADGLAQVQGQCIYGVIAPEHRDAFRALTERVCRGEPGTLEFELVGFKGTRRWMQTRAAPFHDESRGETLLLAITRDITSQRRAERALAESEQRFRSFMDSVPLVAWTKDAAFRYTWVNEGFKLRRGFDPQWVRGRSDTEVWGADIGGQFHQGDLEALRRNAPVQSTNPDPVTPGLHWLVVRFPLADATGAMGVGGIAIDITERVALERALRDNEARIVNATETVRQLMSRLMHAQEAERHRVAGDLHDLIGQKLTALGISLDIVRQQMPQASASAVAGRLHQMSSLLEETIGAIREVMADLRPEALDEHGLSAAIYQYAAAFEARTGLRVQVNAAEPRLPLPRDVAIALFRIAQEALTNAAKHSGGSRALVRLRKNRQRVELLVEDDGCGIRELVAERRRTRGGWGLRMMRERADAVGGELTIAPAHPGTRILVEVPLADADKRHPR